MDFHPWLNTQEYATIKRKIWRKLLGNFQLVKHAAAAAKSLQSCPTLCDPIDSSPPGTPIPGILKARTLGWVAVSFSNVWKGKVKVKSLGSVQLFVTPWTAALQAPPSMGFSRQEYWSGVPSRPKRRLTSPAQQIRPVFWTLPFYGQTTCLIDYTGLVKNIAKALNTSIMC